jgi:hypothetical protein
MTKMIRALLVAGILTISPMAAADPQKPFTPPPQTGFSIIPPGDDVPVAAYPRDPAKQRLASPPAAEPESVGTLPAAQPPQGTAMQRFSSKKGGFSISYPPDWFPISHPSMAFQVRPSLDSLFVIRVQVNRIKKGTTSEAFAKAQAKRFAKYLTIDTEEAAMLAGLPAWRIRHVQIIEGRATRGDKLFLAQGERAYMIDCQTNPSAFADFQAICDRSAASFTIDP